MRNRLNIALALALAIAGSSGLCFAASAAFQQGPGRGPITVARDPETEKTSARSLDAAKFYFYKRKKAAPALDRLQEIVDVNPTFSRIDEVYFTLGEVYKNMGDLDKAVDNWTKASEETSDEKLKSQIQKRLDEAKSQSKDQKKG